MPTTVEKATPAHISSLVEMMREFYGESNFPLDEVWATESFNQLLSNTTYGAAWIISDDGHPVGYVVLTIGFRMEYGGLCGTIDDLFVRPHHRKRGLASLALHTLSEECKRRELLALHVEVAPDNQAAIALYQKMGLRTRDDERLVLVGRLDGVEA